MLSFRCFRREGIGFVFVSSILTFFPSKIKSTIYILTLFSHILSQPYRQADNLLKEHFIFCQLIFNLKVFVFLIHGFFNMHCTTLIHANLRADHSEKDFACLKHIKLIENGNVSFHTLSNLLFSMIH